jgi:hypothetical protein
MPLHPVFDVLERSGVFRITADTTPDEARTKLLALRDCLFGADPVTVALSREHVLRMLRDLGYADPATILTATLGRPDAARWTGSAPEAAAALGPLIMSAADLASRPELLVPPDPTIPALAWKGRVTLLAGREKAGKSTLLSAGLSAYSRGLPFLGDPTPGGRALYWSADREAFADWLTRLRRFGADLSKIDLLLRPPLSFEEVAECVPGYGVLVVDTLASASTSVEEASSSVEWLRVLLPYVDLARRTGVAVVLLHHASKLTGKYRDSTAIGATVDVIIEMARGADPDTRDLETIARFPAPATRAVRLAGAADRAWIEAVGAMRPQTDARLLKAVEDAPGLSGEQYRKLVKARKDEVLDGLKRLEHDGAIRNDGTPNRPVWVRAALAVPPVPIGSGDRTSGDRFPVPIPLGGEPDRTAAGPGVGGVGDGNRSEVVP